MYNIQQIKTALVGSWHISNEHAVIKYLLHDSRKLHQAENTLFFAAQGKHLDGHNYIDELFQKGVRNFVVEQDENIKKRHDVNYVLVKDSLQALQLLATYHRNQFDIPVLAITGSNGKTIVKEWCHQLLHKDYTICRSPKSYNSQLGVPLSVWSLHNEHNLGIFEAGISESDEMMNLEKIIKPTIGIFTTISSAHSENFINLQHKIKEKLRLFINCKTLIFNSDNSEINQAILEVFGNKTQLSKVPKLLDWGEAENAKIRITSKQVHAIKATYNLSYQEKQFTIKFPFKDYSSLQNAMHCVALMISLNYDENTINKRLQDLQRIAMRLEQKKGINNTIIINDSYNSDIDSLKIAIDFLNQQKHQAKRTVILSDILQSGLTGVDLYTAVNELLISNKIERFIAIGKHLQQHKFLFKQEDFKQGLFFYPDTLSFLSDLHENDFENETILLKGARKFQFEQISAALEEKAHATVLEINLDALLHNYKLFSALLQPEVKMMVMVKAFSYGASSVEIARLLEFNRVDYFGVAYADEGVTLRKAGIETLIMVLNPEERSFNTIIKYNLEPEIYSFSLLKAFIKTLNKAVKKQEEQPYQIHLNIDTGMKRLGFETSDIDSLVHILNENKNIQVASIFSHLAASDEPDLDDFTQHQIKQFKSISDKIIKGIAYTPILHLANSSGISRFPASQFDMVRLGIGMYGFNTDMQGSIKTVTQLKTKISQLKKAKKGETIGYGRKGVVTRDSIIATIAIGYADGLNRLLSNGVGEVFVNGKRAPIIGNICMDMAMIDVTDVSQVNEGDVVEIFGDNISANEIAQKTNTIPYEVLCSVSERVKRVYYVDSQSSELTK